MTKKKQKTAGIYAQNLFPEIDGLDYAAALARFKLESAYLEIIKSYVKSTPDILSKIKEVSMDDLENYTIIVHGIKSSSRAIGANDVGLKAEALEKAAKQQDIDFCIAKNTEFYQTTMRLIDELSQFLESKQKVVSKPEKAAPDKRLLCRLKEAVKNYDIAEVDALMEELECYSYKENNDLILTLREYIDNSDFSAAFVLL